MIVEIHCSPSPPGTTDSRYAHVEAAIAQAQSSGLTYEVGALGTTIEGSPEQLWPLLRRMHEATLDSGAQSVMSNVRISQRAQDDGPRMAGLVAPFRGDSRGDFRGDSRSDLRDEDATDGNR